MDFDQVLEEIGEFGRYQQTNYLLICLPVMFAAANSLSYVFTAGIPRYRCFIPECDNHSNPIYDKPWLKDVAPGVTDINGIFTPDQCQRFRTIPNFTSDNFDKQCPVEIFSKSDIISCDEWIFDSDERTIVQEWHITCKDNAWKLAFVGTMHFAGLVVGTATSGFLADRFGRKRIFILCIIFMAITGILQGVSWNYESFIIFAFLNAVGTSGVYPLAFIIGVEMVGPKMREMSSIVLNYFYAFGEAIVGLFAWLCHDWQILQFILSAPPIIFIIYYWFVPESVRWLLAKDEHQKAGKIIRKAARINGKDISEGMILELIKKDTNDDNKESTAVYVIQTPTTEESTKHEIYRTLKLAIQSRILLLRFAALFYIWAANAFIFYGLSLNSTNLSGNKYLNFALVCLVEIPGYSLAWVGWILMNKAGRRWSLSGSLFLCAVTCIAGGYVTTAGKVGLTWAIVTLFLIGKLGVTSSFAIIYAYTAEMMPTIIRSGGVGCMSTVARFGAMVAPFVPLLDIYYKPLPLLLFGCVAFLAAILALILPETFRKKLPDTVEEAEKL